MLRTGLRTGILAILVLTSACAPETTASGAQPSPPSFVGRQTCAGCHAEQDRLWQGSHHDLAMQEASEGAVLGRFDGAAFTHSGVTTTFFRRGGRFVVRTDGPDGQLHEYPVAYTFGVAPLQQYLVELPGGRLQALGIAWDSRPTREGGQRWYPLYPGETIPAGDPLHWTGPNQRWNSMCAECHSTGLQKGYRKAEDRYETTWSEIDVSCEACHGPGSNHVAWARGDRSDDQKGFDVRLKDPGRATWIPDPQTGDGRRLAPAAATDEIDTCGRCHARRSPIAESAAPGQPLLDSHLPVLLDEGLYFADGQIQEEVFEHGSFLQSRMHRAGVTCSDCHEPHSLKLRAEGNALCGRCHSPAKFDTPDHHRHAGSGCVDCHMPARTYMGVDARRDHSLRVPRPDLTVEIGTPNACTGCHPDRSPAWAAEQVAAWTGRPPAPHYGEALHAGRAGLPGAEEALAALAGDAGQPAIVRATALSLLRSHAPGALPVLQRSLDDPDPLVRLAAVTAAEGLDPAERPRLIASRLRDPVRATRIAAARVLATAPAEGLSAAERADFEAALAEYRQSQEVNADRAESRLNLSWLSAREGDLAGAEAELEAALRLDPSSVAARVNLADLRRQQGRDAEGERLLLQAAELAPGDARVRYALGLLLIRTGRRAEAVDQLGRAARLDPREPLYAYAYGLAVNPERRPE